MPRKTKNQSATKTAPGQPYGVAGEQVAAMQQVPVPDTRVAPEVPTTSANVPPMPPIATGPEQTSGLDQTGAPAPGGIEAALADALAMPAPTTPAFSTPVTDTERQEFQAQPMNPMEQRTMSPVVKLLEEMAVANAGDEQLEEMVRNAIRMGF